MKDILRSLTPSFVLEWNRARKKQNRRIALDKKRKAGEVWTRGKLTKQLIEAGIDPSKDLLVHSSLSAMGFVEGGPATVVQSLLDALNEESTLLMPTSPVVTLQAEHHLEVFDVAHTPSRMGAITEIFRTAFAHARSAHPLEPVAAYGPKASAYCTGHHTDATPYGPNSPWRKHMDWNGQILYIGTTLINSGTSLHAVEDAIGWKSFKFPVYLENSKTFKVTSSGRTVDVVSKVHNPQMSAKRECDGLIPLLEDKGALRQVTIGEAKALWVDAGQMKSILLEAYTSHGVTMYTTSGS
jgi:aminoglycoside 3-N-acetyltransferase